jgi:preprotein translocase subunit SecF
MHKSVILALVSLVFVASPLVMFGTSLQAGSEFQNSEIQTTDFSSQNSVQTIPIDQEQMQQQQFENLQLMSLGEENQNNESQITVQPQQEELKELSIITQEKMQQQQYENFKQLMESVRDKQIQVTQD